MVIIVAVEALVVRVHVSVETDLQKRVESLQV